MFQLIDLLSLNTHTHTHTKLGPTKNIFYITSFRVPVNEFNQFFF